MSGDDIDIVERLRYGDNTLTAAEVIAEIERLRAEVERTRDYACRMDALAEERLMQATMLRTAGQQLLAALTAHDPHHHDCSCHRAHGTCDCGVHDACNEWEQEARRG